MQRSHRVLHLSRGVVVMEKIKIEQHSVGGLLWVSGWLFTIGFLKLTFWKGVLAVLLWPYYVGVWVSAIIAAGS
ncbi:MAG TPA: hypothetical protein VL693_02735 [Vicinamibacterales bacterium]|nr:hypothetical protein [Vicinamibacterales bacterium]